MSRTTAARVALLALACVTSSPSTASAATVTVQPSPAEARSFATTNGGWTSAVDYNGLVCIPGVTCPAATPSYQTTNGAGGAGDGYLRNSFGTLLGVLSTTTIAWSSPSFVAPAATTSANLSVKLRPQIASLLAIGSVKLTASLVDVADGAQTTTLPDVPLTMPSASFGTINLTVPPSAVVAGRSYRVRLAVSLTTAVSAVTSGTVDVDDVALTLTDAVPPSGLTATVPPSGPARVTGSANAEGQSTDVTVDYGLTTAYGSTTTPVTLAGATSGSQPFSIPLAGLTPGATYHYRVNATNADGTVRTTDATFVAPSAPSTAVPTVSGAATAATRTVTFTRAADVTAAVVELLDGDDTLIDSFPDSDGDGSVSVTLPADGNYAVRVVRTNDAGLSSTSAGVPLALDRTGPDVSGLDLTVTPASSSDDERSVSFTRPADAATATAQVIDVSDLPVGLPVTVTGGTATVTLGAADGAYRVRLTLADPSGNTSQATSTAVTLDTAAPDAGPAPTVTGAGNDRDRSVTFTRAPDATTVVVELLDGSGVIGTFPVASGVTTTISLPNTDGSYGVRVKQTDAAGNSATSPATAIVLDRVAPDAGPAPTASGEPDDLVVTFVRAPDAVSATIEVRDAGGTLVVSVPVPSANSATVRLPAAVGEYTIRVVQVDASGNSSASPDLAVERAAAAKPVGNPPVADPPKPHVADPPKPRAIDEPARCSKPSLVLTKVALRNGRVQVSGWTAAGAGTKVEIVDRSQKRVGTATTGASGRFTAVVPAPRSATQRKALGYHAVVGGKRSIGLKLRAANALISVVRSGTTVTLRGRVDLRRVGAIKAVDAIGGTGDCPGTTTGFKPLGAPTIDRRTGRYTLRVKAAEGGSLIVRTRVTGARTRARSGYLVR